MFVISMAVRFVEPSHTSPTSTSTPGEKRICWISLGVMLSPRGMLCVWGEPTWGGGEMIEKQRVADKNDICGEKKQAGERGDDFQ